MNMETPNRNSVQTISPTLGLTRKLPPLSSSAWAKMTVGRVIGLEEEGDQARHQPVEEARLGEREAEPLDRRDLVAHLGLPGHGLDDLAEDDADADAGAHGAEAAAHAEGDRLACVRARISLGEDRREEGQQHGGSPLYLVVLGDRAAEVDGSQGGEDERLQGGHEAHLEEEDRDPRRDDDHAERLDPEQHGETAGH